MWSEIQEERARLRAGAADHHGLVRRLLLLAEKEIAMIGYPLDDPGLAGATDTFGAGVVHRYAGIQQCVEDRLADSTVIVRLLRASFTWKPPSAAGFSFALKYST